MTHNNEIVPIITIDGLSGTGKSTVGPLLAQQLGWHFLNSGYLYRVLAWSASEHGIDCSDIAALVVLAQGLDVQFSAIIAGQQSVLCSGRDVTSIIRTEAISNMASQIALVPAVRAALLSYQLNCAQLPGLVADGRDMGTVVFPEAKLKIFLTASLIERVKRRKDQLKDSMINVTLTDLEQSVLERDQRDQQRLVAPVLPANDAVLINTDTFTPLEVVSAIIKLLAK